MPTDRYPVVRAQFERRVHRFISTDNSETYETVLRQLGPVIRR